MNQFYELYKKAEYGELLDYSVSLMDTLDGKYWYLIARWKLGKIKQGIMEGKNLLSELDDNDVEGRGKLLSILGVLQKENGEHTTAIANLQESINILQNYDKPEMVIVSYNHLGEIYSLKGRISLSIQYFNNGLKILESGGDQVLSGILKLNLGKTYRKLGYMYQSVFYLKDALHELQDSYNTIKYAEALSELVFSLVVNSNIEQAEDYFEILKEFGQNHFSDNIIQIYVKYARAILLKYSKRNKDKVMAQEIFEDLIVQSNSLPSVLINIINHIVELLINEYRLYNQQVVFDEILEYINQVYFLSKENHYITKLLNVLIVKTRLDLIQGRKSEAESHLENAFKVVEDYNIPEYLDILENERDNLEKITLTKEQFNRPNNIISKMEEVNIFDFIKQINQLGIVEFNA